MKNIQTLTPIRKYVESYLRKNKNASLKTLFKHSRVIEKTSFIGDWPLITEIVYTCAKQNKFFGKNEVAKVFRQTNDSFLKRLRSDSQLVAKLTNKEELTASIQDNK